MHQTADHQTGQHDYYSLVIRYYDPPTGRREINVVYLRNGIFVAVGGADSKWNERSDFQMLPDIASHI